MEVQVKISLNKSVYDRLMSIRQSNDIEPSVNVSWNTFLNALLDEVQKPLNEERSADNNISVVSPQGQDKAEQTSLDKDGIEDD